MKDGKIGKQIRTYENICDKGANNNCKRGHTSSG